MGQRLICMCIHTHVSNVNSWIWCRIALRLIRVAVAWVRAPGSPTMSQSGRIDTTGDTLDFCAEVTSYSTVITRLTSLLNLSSTVLCDVTPSFYLSLYLACKF